MASAQINDLTVEHNRWGNGENGMIIRAAVDVQGLRGIEVEISAYFHYSDGTPLKAFGDPDYRTEDGNVAVSQREICKYAATSFPEVQLFLPYSALHMVPGKHELLLQVVVWNLNYVVPEELARSRWERFWLEA